MRKQLKIYYNYNNGCLVPMLMLKGKWLEKLDFKVGDRIEVECKKNRIIIKKSPCN